MNGRIVFIVASVIALATIGALYPYFPNVLLSLLIVVPLILLGISDLFQKKHTIKRNFPVIGNLRYFFESIRPEIMQYFVETDTEGRPINRIFRSLIYQRAKNVNDTEPFGTQMNVYRTGYEWLDHTMYAVPYDKINKDPRMQVGGKDCQKPYNASILNISAMSFGSLSKNAVMALNKGAKLGGFAQNTGEGGISPYHLKYGGDLIWQIGTGYFGCRDDQGKFSEEGYIKNATRPEVKMIELKISQGAKPGHGGILPASKNTEEIAKIRHVEPHTTVYSPPSHSAFSDAKGLVYFLQKLRDLSGGKPVGFKLCVGKKQEFIDICRAMIKEDIYPDFITVDGGEGGTGAAPVEFTNSIGMPLRDGLLFVYETLVGYDIKDKITLIASGRIFTGFHVARAIALGADLINSARAMMLSVGCIQALQCNVNTCPTGVATQKEALIKGLDVEDKAKRCASYHEKTIHSLAELLSASGVSHPKDLTRAHINKRMGLNKVMKYSEIFPEPVRGALRKEEH